MTDETKDNTSLITTDFIDLLRTEAIKVWASCVNLNADRAFTNGVLFCCDQNFKEIQYKAEHILMYDLVKVFNNLALLNNKNSEISINAKFILIYFYEKLQGKDLSSNFNLKKLNALTKTNLFENNVQKIRETSFFQPVESLKSEFISTSVLKKIRSNEFESIASFLNRMALLIANTDTIISDKEEICLKQIALRISSPKTLTKEPYYNEVPDSDTLEVVLEELNELIGLQNIKKNIVDLTNFLKVQKLRKENGLKTTSNSLHAVFMGPPGTGKTTVARLLGRIYKHLGYLEKGHLVETDRSGLVAGYVGQTAIKTDEIISTAQGGVLFIDEAYSLAKGGFNDFGNEAIEILLKRMEDYRSGFVVVVAGYPDEMEIFIESNPGLQSRFNRYFDYDHFNPDELIEIFKLNTTKADFTLTEDAIDKLNEIIDRIYEKRHRGFGNARTMRNLFEKVIEQQANRIVNITPITKEVLRTLTEEDIPDILTTVKQLINFDEES